MALQGALEIAIRGDALDVMAVQEEGKLVSIPSC